MNFQDSVKYLYSLGNEVTTMKLGLETTGKLLAALGNPEKNFLKIQIAGTNGKGSTCAFLDAICRSASIETGLFTSPHLISITERIKIGGKNISEKDFARQATKIRRISENLIEMGEVEAAPTFFEQMTAIAVSFFAEAKIELAILETGLGGRLDSVTATNAEIVAITPIDLDHQQILGETLTEIAAEKAAIIRTDTLVFVAPQKREAENVINGKCREVGVTPIPAIPDVRLIERLDGGLNFLSLTTAENNYKFNMQMRGRHQWTNATLAVYIAEKLRDYDFKISKENILNGLENAEHQGRLEFWRVENALTLLFDGAHNIAGANALKDYLDEYIKEPLTIIFGAMRDKDLTEIAALIFPKAERLIFTEPDNPRAYKAEELMEFLPPDYDIKNVFRSADIAEAIKIAERISGKNDLICITGSLYLVGEAQKLLNNKSEI